MKTKIELITTGKIAKQIGVPRNRVQFAVKYLKISPYTNAGRYKLFKSDEVAKIREYLSQVDARRQDAAITLPIATIQPQIIC